MGGTQCGLRIDAPRKFGSSIIIYDVDKTITKEQFLEQLWSKNLVKLGLCREANENKVRFRFGSFSKARDTNNFVIEVSGEIRRKIIEQGRLYIEWRSYKVNDFISPTRCFRCLGYGHSIKYCKDKDSTCGYCGNIGHLSPACPDKQKAPSCANCIKARRKDVKHSSRDLKCPEYLRILEISKNKIDYT